MDSTHRPTHLADLVEAAAARHADHPALIDAATDATLTLGRARRHRSPPRRAGSRTPGSRPATGS